MTLQQNAKFMCELLVQDYIDNDKCTIYPFWDVMKIIKHALDINALKEHEAERYCYNMHITFDEMLTADN